MLHNFERKENASGSKEVSVGEKLRLTRLSQLLERICKVSHNEKQKQKREKNQNVFLLLSFGPSCSSLLLSASMVSGLPAGWVLFFKDARRRADKMFARQDVAGEVGQRNSATGCGRMMSKMSLLARFWVKARHPSGCEAIRCLAVKGRRPKVTSKTNRTTESQQRRKSN